MTSELCRVNETFAQYAALFRHPGRGFAGMAAHGGAVCRMSAIPERKGVLALPHFMHPPILGSRGRRNGRLPDFRTEQVMSKLDSAMERFTAALDRLEAGINRQAVRGQAAAHLQEEVAALREDRARLADELDQMKSEARRLNELNERASETLANAIEGIREVLA